MMVPIVTWLIILSLVTVNSSLEVQRFIIDLERGSSVNIRLLTNCSRASLISVDPQVEIRFEGDCSSDVVRIIHLGFIQPSEHVLEFASETTTRVSLVSLKVVVKENPKLNKLFKKHKLGTPILKVNETLADILSLHSDRCRARVRLVPKHAVLTGLCDDPRLWSDCENIGDLQTPSNVEDSLVLTLNIDGNELNVGILINPSEQIPGISFEANLRVEIVSRLLIAIRRNVLSSAEDDSTIFHVVQQVSSCSFVKAFSKTPVSQFTQRSLDRLEVGLYCRKGFDEATITLIALNVLGLSSEPFFVSLSKSVSIDLSIKSLVLRQGGKSATLIVKSSRDAELRIVEGLSRGILNTDGLPVVTFGTNVPLEYKPHTGLSYRDELIADNLVVNYCDVEFIITVLLLEAPPQPVDLTSLTVVAGHQTTLSRKSFESRISNFGNVHFELRKPGSSSDKLFCNGNRSRTFSIYDIDDLNVTFRSSDPSKRQTKLEFFTKTAGSEATRLVCELKVVSASEDSKPPVQAECSLQLTVNPRSLRVALERTTLNFRDDPADDEYNGHGSCASGVYFIFDSQNSKENGYLGFANGEQTNRFSQSDVNRGNVFYYTPTVFSRINAKKIYFEFRAEDKHGNLGPTLKLQVYLKAVKISKTIHSEIAFDGGGSALGTNIISAAVNSSSTMFGIISLPSLGKISRRKNVSGEKELRLWDNFSYSELTSRNVWYETDRHDVESDTFELLAVNSKDHIVQKRKAHKRAKLKRRKFKRNAMQYIRIIVKITSADQMTGTEGGKDRLKFNITVDEGRKNSISIQGLNFTLIEPPKNGLVYIAQGTNPKTQMMITYVHSGTEMGVDTGVDGFVLQNPSGEAEVNVLVLPVDNTAPVIKVPDATVVLEGESSLVNWDLSDIDSKVFWCHIPEPPVFGQLTIRAHKFTEFNNSDSKNVVYEQLKHAHVEPSEDYFKVRCSDGVNLSPLKQIQIVIKDQNDEAPHLAVAEVTVLEGREAPVKIHASDQDSPRNDLRFTVNESPKHGLIAILSTDGHNEAVIEFSEKSLSRVVYVHDNSENHRDSFELTVSDGRHSTKQVVNVRVLAVDDEPPKLVVNRGIRVEVGTSVVIDARHLQVDDIDSTSDTIYFKIVEGPQNGILLDSADKNQSIASFRLEDVKLQKVVYAHRSKICCRGDSFTFRITDGFNETPLYEFNITVHLPELFVPQLIRTHQIRLQHRPRTEQLFNISTVQWLAVTKWPSNGNLSFENDTVGFRIDTALTSGSNEDTFAIVLKNGSTPEAATFDIEWCTLSLTVAPSEIISGKTFFIELRRSGCNSTAEGIVRTSLGDFPFSIPSSTDRKSLPLIVPENFNGDLLLELGSVHGCLMDTFHKKFRTVVLPPMHHLHFERQEYSVEEPGEDKLRETLFVRVVRGDVAATRSKIDFRVVTVAGTARESEDFIPFDQVLSLQSEDDGLVVPVEILGESHVENSRFFTILLEPLRNGPQLKPSKTVVRINDAGALPSFTEFPVIFALDPETGNPLTHSRLLPRGASFYCATECDTLSPRHSGLCSGFNSSEQIEYQWKTSTDTGLKSIKSKSFLLRTNQKVLQSFPYLLPGSNVVCSARIVTANGEGTEIDSEPYLISNEPSSASCPGSVGSTPFSSKLRAVFPSNSSAELSFALSVILPHHDGSWPFWSTRPILVADTERQLFASKHRCSNMLQNRSETTFKPNVTSCTWNYELTYSMSELLNCGARFDETDLDDLSTVSLLLPIHVMYIVHQSPKKWHHVSLSSELRVSFVYKTRVIGNGRLEPQDPTELSAILQIQHTSLDKNGSLVVVFETNTNFDGLLAADPKNFNESVIEIHDRTAAAESLFKLKKEEIISERKSLWSFSSLVSHPLYANNFSLSFLPCVGDAVGCELVQDKPITLTLPVHIKSGQTSTQNHSLESQLLLTKKEFWMTDISDAENVIHEGEAVYGSVRVSNQDLPDQVLITRIQKCYICRDVPETAHKPASRCPYKVIDAESMISAREEFRGLLASKNFGAFSHEELEVLKRKNADGFIFDSSPLFERENEGSRWRVHCIFVVSFGYARERRDSEDRVKDSARMMERSALLRLRRGVNEPMSLTVAHPNYISVTFLVLSLSVLLLIACRRKNTSNYTSVPPAEIVPRRDQNAESLL